jgi:hypothetical protein
MSTYANYPDLYSEEIGLTGEQLGYFSQTFSHLALINAVPNLDLQLDHGAGWVEPVLSAGRGECWRGIRAAHAMAGYPRVRNVVSPGHTGLTADGRL